VFAVFLVGLQAKSIQSYLFASPALRHMIGGSEIVEQVCTKLLKQTLSSLAIKGRVRMSAAGKAWVACETSDDAEMLTRFWPVIVETFAPGLQVNVAMGEGHDEKSCLKLVDDKLRALEGFPRVPCLELSPIIERARHTGGAAVTRIKASGGHRELADALVARQNAVYEQGSSDERLRYELATPEDMDWPHDMYELAGEEQPIAVIHADGNGLGQKIKKLETKSQPLQSRVDISEAVSKATIQATREAAKSVLYHDRGLRSRDGRKVIPARPLVLGGDDVTFIVRGDLALRFTEAFLKAFEQASDKTFNAIDSKATGLTACAGIAIVKPSFPFFQAYELAESLCAWAKKQARKHKEDSSPSCLAFHRLTGSVATDFEDDILTRELTGADGVLLAGGPYQVGSIASRLARFEDLQSFASRLSKRPRGARRQFLTNLQLGNTEHAWQRFLELAGKQETEALRKLHKTLTGNETPQSGRPSPLLDAHVLNLLESKR